MREELRALLAGLGPWQRALLLARAALLALWRTARACVRWRTVAYAAAGCLLLGLLVSGALRAGLAAGQPEAVPVLAPASEGADTLVLFYDDRLTLPDGTQVLSLGENTPRGGDAAVLTWEDGALRACGVGETVLTLSTGTQPVRVEPAPISLLLLIGQSNMEGNEGEPALSACGPAGQVYSTYGPSSEKLAGVVGGNSAIPLLSMSTADSLVPSALAGEGSAVSRAGSALVYPLDALAEGGGGKGGLDSGIAWGWQAATGEKVWVVNAAHSGSPIASWQSGAPCFRAAVALFSAAQQTLGEELAAGHYTLSRMGYFWLQGCSDKDRTAAQYRADFLAMDGALRAALRCPWGELSFAAILMVQAADGTEDFTTWRELRYNGPRQAQYALGADMAEGAHIHVVSTIMEDWVYDENGENDGVRAYFAGKYGEALTYPIQSGAASRPLPETPRDVKDSIHYNQVGYNEIGFDAAGNLLARLG